MHIIPRIRTERPIPLLTVAQTIARRSGHGNAEYQGSYSTQLVPNDPEHKYAPLVNIVIEPDQTYMPDIRRYLATIESGIGGLKKVTPEEALSHLTDDIHIIFSLPEITTELVEQVQSELRGINPQ